MEVLYLATKRDKYYIFDLYSVLCSNFLMSVYNQIPGRRKFVVTMKSKDFYFETLKQMNDAGVRGGELFMLDEKMQSLYPEPPKYLLEYINRLTYNDLNKVGMVFNSNISIANYLSQHGLEVLILNGGNDE